MRATLTRDPHSRSTAVAIAGKDFAVIASDTRLSLGYSILSRNVSKSLQLCVRAVRGGGRCGRLAPRPARPRVGRAGRPSA